MAEGEGLRRRSVPTRPLSEFRSVGRILGPDDRELHGRDRNGSRTYSSLIQYQPLSAPKSKKEGQDLTAYPCAAVPLA
jgi:hypothetical protein